MFHHNNFLHKFENSGNEMALYLGACLSNPRPSARRSELYALCRCSQQIITICLLSVSLAGYYDLISMSSW